MFEPLEPRMLLSGVPAGFVEVGSYTIDTGSATPVMTADLTPGVKHIAVASGTFKVGGPSSHIADAEYHQRGPTKAWNDLTTLTGHNTDMGLDDASGRLVHWGPHEADAEYEQEFTPTTSAPLELFYQDVEGQGPNGAGSTWYDHNVGSLHLDLFRRIDVDSFSITDSVTEDSATTTGGTASNVVSIATIGASGNNDDYTVNLGVAVSPSIADAYTQTAYSITGVNTSTSTSTVLSSGLFDADGNIDVTFAGNGYSDLKAETGVDSNGNGQVDAGEVTHRIEMKAKLTVNINPVVLTSQNQTQRVAIQEEGITYNGVNIEVKNAAGAVVNTVNVVDASFTLRGRQLLDFSTTLQYDGVDDTFTVTITDSSGTYDPVVIMVVVR